MKADDSSSDHLERAPGGANAFVIHISGFRLSSGKGLSEVVEP